MRYFVPVISPPHPPRHDHANVSSLNKYSNDKFGARGEGRAAGGAAYLRHAMLRHLATGKTLSICVCILCLHGNGSRCVFSLIFRARVGLVIRRCCVFSAENLEMLLTWIEIKTDNLECKIIQSQYSTKDALIGLNDN